MVKLSVFLFVSLGILIFPSVIFAQSATLFFSPASGSFAEGESFWVSVMVDTKGELVNALAAYFSYSQDQLEPLGMNTAGSPMTLWAEKEALSGKVKIAGGLPTPGFSGNKKVASVGFKVKVSSGSASFKFGDDSAVLTDKDNRNILSLSASGNGSYSFKQKSTAPQSTSTESVLLISDVQTKDISQTGATITWKTNKDSTSVLEYGLSDAYGFSVSDDNFTKEHSLMVFALSPGTSYHYAVKSQTKTGEAAATADAVFSSLGYAVEIKVLSALTGEAMSGVEVVFSDSSGEIARTANEEGKAVFENFPLGEHWIAIRNQGKSSRSRMPSSACKKGRFFVATLGPTGTKNNILFLAITAVIVIIGVILLVAFGALALKILKKRSNEIQPPAI